MNFFSKIFGSKKEATTTVEQLVEDTLNGIINAGQFDLKFTLDTDAEGNIKIELAGDDEELVTSKDGQILESFQLFLKRVCQHRFPEDNTEITIDCGGFWEESNQALIELAEKLKNVAIDKGRSVYFRALPPKDRKVIHQYLSADERVKSRSVGEGLFKKIKIYPAKEQQQEREDEVQA
jgi:spoIIIJ-associated protein